MIKPEALRWSANLTCLGKSKKRDFHTPRFILMTDDERLGSVNGVTRALHHMPPNAAVIVRSKEDSRLQSLVNQLRPICTNLDIALLAATRPSLAAAMDVDGIHLSQSDVRMMNAVPSRNARNWIITAAAHSVSAVIRARRIGADLILISPVFPTRSHPSQSTLGSIGYRRLAYYAPNQACPLGGMTALTLRNLKGAPITAVAGIDLFIGG